MSDTIWTDGKEYPLLIDPAAYGWQEALGLDMVPVGKVIAQGEVKPPGVTGFRANFDRGFAKYESLAMLFGLRDLTISVGYAIWSPKHQAGGEPDHNGMIIEFVLMPTLPPPAVPKD